MRKLDRLCIAGEIRIAELITKKTEGISHTVEIGIFVIVAIVVGLLFKDKIVEWATSFFTTLGTKTTTLWG